MQESTTRYIFASILALVAFIEPTINFLTAIVFVVTLDCFSAFNLNRRIKKKYPKYSTGKIESRKAIKMIYTIAKIYGVITLLWFIEIYVLKEPSLEVTKYVTALFCFIQLISILENESSCNEAWWARVLQKILSEKTKRHFDIDIDIDQLKKEQEEEDNKKYGGKSNENNK